MLDSNSPNKKPLIYYCVIAVTLILLWLYCCFMVQMIGAEINEELRARKGE